MAEKKSFEEVLKKLEEASSKLKSEDISSRGRKYIEKRSMPTHRYKKHAAEENTAACFFKSCSLVLRLFRRVYAAGEDDAIAFAYFNCLIDGHPFARSEVDDLVIAKTVEILL